MLKKIIWACNHKVWLDTSLEKMSFEAKHIGACFEILYVYKKEGVRFRKCIRGWKWKSFQNVLTFSALEEAE